MLSVQYVNGLVYPTLAAAAVVTEDILCVCVCVCVCVEKEQCCHNKTARGYDVTDKQKSLPSTVEQWEAPPSAMMHVDAIG